MAKKKPGTVPNRHIYTRISFLYQASAYLSQIPGRDSKTASNDPANLKDDSVGAHATHNTNGELDHANLANENKSTTGARNLSRRLLTDLRAIGQKTVTRASPQLKRSICKYCDSLLVDGQTSSSAVENKSKGAKKPWADIWVVRCNTCGGEKRFPVSPKEHKRRPFREDNTPKPADQGVARTTDSQAT